MSAQWYEVYEARFGKKLTSGEIKVWEEEFKREIRNRGEGEVTNAIRDLANELRQSKTKKYPPSVNEIITAVIRGKYQARKADEGDFDHQAVLVQMFSHEAGRDEYKITLQPARDWQSRLYQCRNQDEAWNVICEPMSVDDCRTREHFCRDNHIAYRRLTP